MPTHYQTLGIPETATLQEIKSAFRKLSLRYHPDRNNGDKIAEAKFLEVLEAYKVLSDPDKRTWYDRLLFHKRQPPPPSSQPQATAQPVYQQNRPFRRVHRRYTEEYVQPDFSRMPWRFMGIITGGLILFFVLLYHFGPKPRDINKELQEEETRLRLISASEISKHKLKLQEGDDTDVLEFGSRFPYANTVELFTDVDGDGNDELQLSVTYPGQEMFVSKDYIFRQTTQDGHYEEFFRHTGGMYIVGNNIRLYFDAAIETYHSCGTCRIDGLPNQKLVPAIYLKVRSGRILFAETNLRRNREIEENLAFLKTRETPGLKDGLDDGTRKEYIRQIVAYYFNNRDYQVTENLFRKYYHGADQSAVWQDATEIIEAYAQKITSNAAFSNKEVF